MLIRNYMNLDVELGKKWQYCKMCVGRGRGECSCNQVQQEQRLIQTWSCLYGGATSFISTHLQALVRADQLCSLRQWNVTPMAGRVMLPWWSSAQQLDGLGGCSSQLSSTCAGRENILSAAAAFLHPCCAWCSQGAASCSSCCFQGMVRQILQLWESAAGLQKKQCSAHAKRGAELFTNGSSDAACCCVVICTAVWSQTECLRPEGRELT